MKKSLKNRMGTVLLLCSSLLLIMPLSAIAQESENGNEESYDQAYSDNIAEIEANKAAFAQELAAKWEAEALERGNDETWLERISGVLSEEDADSLLIKSEAESYDEFIGLQTTSELVLYPLKPCRVLDTRFATKYGGFGNPVPSGGTINVRTYPNLAGQGGASNCGVLTTSAAVVINVTAVPVSGGQGFLTVWPFGQSRPTASLVNYNSSSTSGAIANAVTQSQCRSCSQEINVYASRTTHVIVDVIGYFARPTRTMPDTQRLATTRTILAGQTVTFSSPTCPSGWARTGGNCNPGSSYRLIQGGSFISPANQGFMTCNYRNPGPGSATAFANVVCLRQPGR